tara:strand:+ start:260 stop:964 length:705 start_codon:yes stop_codon:yes gene_type:complete
MTDNSKPTFPRVNLNVPFPQKEKAKALGARWDSLVGTWYVPTGKDSAPFKKWIAGAKQEDERPNVKSNYFFLATTVNECWKCNEKGDVFALYLPVGFLEAEYENEDDPNNDNLIWEKGEGVGALSFVRSVNPEVLSILSEHAPGYKRAYSKTNDSHYLMNHCPICQSSQGDFFMHNEPGGAFLPMSDVGCERIVVTPFNIQILCSANVGWSTIEYSKMTHLTGPDGFLARLEPA